MRSEYSKHWQPYEYPAAMRDLATRRTRALLNLHMLQVAPFTRIIESAYLQGLIDGGLSVVEATKQAGDKALTDG